jgi:hypothetical protein
MRMRAIVARQPSRPSPVQTCGRAASANHPFPIRYVLAANWVTRTGAPDRACILGAVATRRPNTSVCQHVMLRLAVPIQTSHRFSRCPLITGAEKSLAQLRGFKEVGRRRRRLR